MLKALRRETPLVLLVSSYVTIAALLWSWDIKARWPDAGPTDDCLDRSLVTCYSDFRFLWVQRGLGDHLFPFIHGGIDEYGRLYGGVVEYPTLAGLFMWVSAFGADNDVEFFRNTALLLAPFAIGITLLLAWLTRWYALLWAATPPLVMYAFHNWELPVVFASVAAIAVMAWGASADPATGRRRMPLRTSAVLAAILLGLGFAFKIYPGFFVLPLALYVLTRGHLPRRARPQQTLDVAGACYVVVAAVITVAATQLPFMIAGYRGWRASLEFQSNRKASVDTNTFWYWGVRPLTGGAYDTVVAIASPLLILAAFAVALWLGKRHFDRTGYYPWIGVSAAMLAGFMLFHKVHSPQYTLWILPFFVLLKVRWSIVVAYLAADLLLALTLFRMFAAGGFNAWSVGVLIAVFAHVILLAILVTEFVGAPLREPLASYVRGAAPGPGPLTRLRRADNGAAAHWLGSPTLAGHGVTLRPLQVGDARDLAGVIEAETGDAYRWLPALPHDTASAVAWITDAVDDPDRIAFAVIDDETGELVGTTSFYDADARHCSLAIGYTLYAPAARGTRVNPAAKLLLLDYAFDHAGAVRAVWHAHSENAASRAAITKLGATGEGELRKHKRFGDGWRTTAQYSMTVDDWPGARPGIAARASRSG